MRIIVVPRTKFALPPSVPVLTAAASGTTQINLTAASVSSVGIASYTFEVATSSGGPWTQLVTQASGSYSHTGLTAGSSRYYRVRATASDGQESAGYSAVANATTDSPPSSVLLAPDTESSLFQGMPDVAPWNTMGGYIGSDPDVFFALNGNDNTSEWAQYTGKPGYYYGSLAAGLRGSWGRGGGRGRQVYGLFSGYDNYSGHYLLYGPDFSVNLATAPGPLHFKPGCRLLFQGARITAKHFYGKGIYPPIPDADSADGMGFYAGSSAVAVQFGTLAHFSDETIDFTGRSSSDLRCGVANMLIVEPLSHTRPVGDPDYTHAYSAIVGYNSKNIDYIQNVSISTNGRDPVYVKSDGINVVDCVRYNCGYITGETAWSDQFNIAPPQDQSTAMRVNAVGNIFLKGPNPVGANKPIRVESAEYSTWPSGSRLSFVGNYYDDPTGGWSYSQASQTDHVDLFMSVPGDLLQTSIDTSIWPTGYNSTTVSLSGTQPDRTALLAKAQAIIARAGARPGDNLDVRYQAVRQQPLNYANGTNSANWGGIVAQTPVTFTLPSLTISDPFAADAWGGDPYPWADPGTIEANGQRKDVNWIRRREVAVGAPSWSS